MRRTTVANLLLLVLGLGLAAALAWPRPGRESRQRIVLASHAAAAQMGPPASDATSVRDATGHQVRRQGYQRIVSTNLVTDRLLVELCEPARILAVSRAAAARQRDGYRYQGMKTVDGFGPPEAMVALKPDLVLTNSFGVPGYAARLRDAGIEVFELGELRGARSLAFVVSSLGVLLGVPERAERLLASFTSRMRALPVSLGRRPPRRALFLSTLGPDLQGGTAGTSYHDILVAAGLVDAAAERYRDWPAYSSEQVLALQPEIVVTRRGYAAAICRYPGMDHVGPCRGQGRIVELDGELLDEPGLAMLEAAEDLFAAVYRTP
jgi:iron complex transport system substrate-binding protein